jgi:uncharacterized membrane protein YcaP (DUF421 family)
MWPVAGRTVLIYLLMLLMIRLLGRRTIGNLTAFDMLIALIMGDLAGDAIYGDVSLANAVTAIGSLSALHYLNSWFAYSVRGAGKLVEGEPTLIVKDGRLQRDGMRVERMSEKEVLGELRLEGIEDVSQVKEARVERDGQVSVIRREPA